jgi:hypothetical protein
MSRRIESGMQKIDAASDSFERSRLWSTVPIPDPKGFWNCFVAGHIADLFTEVVCGTDKQGRQHANAPEKK